MEGPGLHQSKAPTARLICSKVFIHLLPALITIAVAGCGPDTGDRVVVTGKVTDSGQPLQGAEEGLTRIEFLLLGEGEDSDAAAMLDTREADIQVDGTYRVELVPGKYAVVVHQRPEYRSEENKLGDLFPGVDSPLKVEIEGGQELNIEIDDYRK